MVLYGHQEGCKIKRIETAGEKGATWVAHVWTMRPTDVEHQFYNLFADRSHFQSPRWSKSCDHLNGPCARVAQTRRAGLPITIVPASMFLVTAAPMPTTA